MNSVCLTGRLVRDPEVRYTDGGMSIARFTLAVNRRFKSNDGVSADFIQCIAFGKTAEFIEKYFSQGRKMDLNGRIQTGSYTNREGNKVRTTDIVVENVEFGESSRTNQESHPRGNDTGPAPDGFMSIPDSIDEELPFA